MAYSHAPYSSHSRVMDILRGLEGKVPYVLAAVAKAVRYCGFESLSSKEVRLSQLRALDPQVDEKESYQIKLKKI